MITELHKNPLFADLNKSVNSFNSLSELKDKERLTNETTPYEYFDWLIENGKQDILENILCKKLLISITGDMLSFLHTGLNCSLNGITNVAYANFRKPLKDNLTLLERIYVDPSDFIKIYYVDGNPKKYDPSNGSLNKKELIDRVFNKMDTSTFGGVLDKELIHQLRFDKSNYNSFDPLSNLALHIVTNDKNYKTEDKNLNFIFSSKEDLKSHWEHIYYFMPYLMTYIFCIIDEIAFSLIDLNKEIKAYRAFKIMMKFAYWTQKTLNIEYPEQLLSEEFKCQNCSEASKLDIHDLKLFFDTDMLPCGNCLNSLITYPKEYEPEIMNMEFDQKDLF